ncbi:hypothetical protein AAG570_005707 [Ranatra chinensis]|uniref:BHLH domain-containing protein n=1 Tax=Ranatra chinensis TaxID=642074 RepID=A0ABD0XY82_9HEMI
MVSKCRNMFHKNKTQETTEKGSQKKETLIEWRVSYQKSSVLRERQRRNELMFYYRRLQKLLPNSVATSETTGRGMWPKQIILQRATNTISDLRKTDIRLETQSWRELRLKEHGLRWRLAETGSDQQTQSKRRHTTVEVHMQENFRLKKKIRDFEMLRTFKRIRIEKLGMGGKIGELQGVDREEEENEATKENNDREEMSKEYRKEEEKRVLPEESTEPDEDFVDLNEEEMDQEISMDEASADDEIEEDPLGNITDNSPIHEIIPSSPDVIAIDP